MLVAFRRSLGVVVLAANSYSEKSAKVGSEWVARIWLYGPQHTMKPQNERVDTCTAPPVSSGHSQSDGSKKEVAARAPA